MAWIDSRTESPFHEIFVARMPCVYGRVSLLATTEKYFLRDYHHENSDKFKPIKGRDMADNKSTPVCIIPRMPAEFIAKEMLQEVAPGFALYKLSPKSRGCILRVGTDPLNNIGDWMGYIAWLMAEEEKDEDQKQAERIMRREIIALHTLTMTDKLTLSAFDVDLEQYRDYKEEVNDNR